MVGKGVNIILNYMVFAWFLIPWIFKIDDSIQSILVYLESLKGLNFVNSRKLKIENNNNK